MADAVAQLAVPAYEWVPADAQMAAELDESVGALLLVRTYRQVFDGEPMQVARSHMPAVLAERLGLNSPLDEIRPRSTMALLARCGMSPESAQVRVVGRPATFDERSEMGLPPGSAVWELWRTLVAAGRRVEVSAAVLRGDMNLLEFDVRLQVEAEKRRKIGPGYRPIRSDGAAG